jgi:UDP-glucose:(heptosyl)LPS alpha-1,3-glucosyltransferase
VKVVQVVKRFGLCGGMEEYAYRLTNKLSTLGVKVQVVCEQKVHEPEDKKIQISELGKSLEKPRWLSHLLFAKKVRNWAKLHADKNTIIHSHERIDCHHLTTIHSTLYNFQNKPSIPSLRNWMNEFIERRELEAAQVIIPVSSMIGDQIRIKYPDLAEKIADPVPPGVSPINATRKIFDPDSPVLGFMGKEWERKGLPKVISIWRELRKDIPNLQLCLAGFSDNEKIGLSKDEMISVQILGYLSVKEEFYSRIDILLHPAKKEAYGMVIAEALSLGIPVVCSKECGIASLQTFRGESLKEIDSIKSWCSKINQQLYSGIQYTFFNSMTWTTCVQQHLNTYKHIKL